MTVKKLTTDLYVRHYDLDPDATTLTDVGWIDMKLYSTVLMSFFRNIGTSAVVFNIVANTASDGSGDEVIVKTQAQAAGAPDAVGDQIFLEVSQEEIASKATDDGYAYRYISANISFATGTDEATVTYIGKVLHNQSGATADIIST